MISQMLHVMVVAREQEQPKGEKVGGQIVRTQRFASSSRKHFHKREVGRRKAEGLLTQRREQSYDHNKRNDRRQEERRGMKYRGGEERSRRGREEREEEEERVYVRVAIPLFTLLL